MAILNYSGGLNAAGSVSPGQRILQGAEMLQGLRANEQAMRQQQQQQEAMAMQQQQEAAARAKGAELLKSGTPDQIAAFGIQNPNIMKDYVAAAKFKDESAVNSRVKYAQDVLSGNKDPRQALMERIKVVDDAGGDSSGLRSTLELDDASIIKAAEKDLAVIAPKMYESYRNATGGQQSSGSTTDIDNWNQYQQLKKTSPEDARQFGQQAGFVTPEGKELSVHLQKRLSNAADEASKSDLNVGKYKTLISDIESANLQGGVIEGSWKEYFKDITGNQDFTTDLRRQYAAIRGSQLVDNLPPGAASDKDIELALAGFPTDNATGEQLTGFLNGLIKLEGHKRDLNEFKANYISEKGTEKGMLKAWRTMQKERALNPNVVKWSDM